MLIETAIGNLHQPVPGIVSAGRVVGLVARLGRGDHVAVGVVVGFSARGLHQGVPVVLLMLVIWFSKLACRVWVTSDEGFVVLV